MNNQFEIIERRPDGETEGRSTNIPVSERDYVVPTTSGTAIQAFSSVFNPIRIPKTTATALVRQLALHPLLLAIEESREILDWEDDWDGEGSKAFLPSTWDRTAAFLRTNYRHLVDSGLELPPVPHIRPGPDGSFDIRWKSGDIRLTVNIPENEAELASFYGQHRSGSKISGTMTLSEDNQWLLLWLTSK